MDNVNYYRIVEELKPFWNDCLYRNRKQFTGTISTIKEERGFGFIKPDDGGNNQFFLFKDFKDDKDFIWNNMRVSYYLENSFDYAKNKESTRAVNVELI